MKQVYVGQPGATGEFAVVERPAPVPAAGQVVVDVQAAGLAFADVLMCAGAYPGTPRDGFTPGYDVVGTIAAVGGEVHGGWQPGDRVAALLVRGGLAEQVAVDAERLVRVPDEVDAVQAACLPLNYVAAWQMLHRVAAARTGDTVLVFGAGGGVGSALCELAALHGCRAIGVAAAAKHGRVSALGAIPVESRTGDLVEAVRLATGGRGVDACFDAVGGAQLAQGARALAPGGHLVSYGFAGSQFGHGSPAAVFLSTQARMAWWRMTRRVRKITFYAIEDRRRQDPEGYAEDLTGLLRLLETGQLAPAVDATVALDDIPPAYQRLRRGAVNGKIIFGPAPRP